jgi:Flp pilus assembly protein TadG
VYGRARRWARHWLRRLANDRRAVTALEFGIVGPPFLLLLVFMTEEAYDFYAQEALNYAVSSAARCVQVGATQGSSAATFQSLICATMGSLLPCGNVTVNVQPISSLCGAGTACNYANPAVPLVIPTTTVNGTRQLNLGTPQYSVGIGNDMMLVQAVYTSPSLVSGFVPGMAVSNGGNGFVHATIASAAFINENYPAGGIGSLPASATGC